MQGGLQKIKQRPHMRRLAKLAMQQRPDIDSHIGGVAGQPHQCAALLRHEDRQ